MIKVMCMGTSYIILAIIAPIFAAKLGVANVYKDKKERKALFKIGFSFILGALVGVLYFIGINLD